MPKTHVEQKGLHDFPPMAGGKEKGRLLTRDGTRGPYAIASNDIAAPNDLEFAGLPYSLLCREAFRIHFFVVLHVARKKSINFSYGSKQFRRE